MTKPKDHSGSKLKLVPSEAVPHPRVAVVIPAYNEEKNIENVLREIHSIREIKPHWAIHPIVVNDGSSDCTGLILEQIADRYGAHAIQLPLNLGIGRAVQTGFKYALRLRADVTFQLDGDGQHPAREIPRIAELILSGKTDVVVGSRYVEGAGGNVSSGLRQFGTAFFSALLKALVGLRIKDSTSGFRAFSLEATEFLSRYYPDDYPEVEAYVPLARRGFKIREVGVKMRPRMTGSSSITPLRGAYYMVKVGLATIMDNYRKLPERRPQLTQLSPEQTHEVVIPPRFTEKVGGAGGS